MKVVPTIFRLDDHLKRFVNSMADIEMKPVPVARLRKVIMELVKKNGIKDGYIRPIAFYGYERLGIYWEGLPVQISIAAMPWGVYLPKEMKLKTSKWRRLSPDSVKIEAKVGGYYINSNYATASVKGQADEALLLDHDGFIAEAACANIFFVKGKTLYTPKRGTILPGLTRDSIIELARSFGFKTVEKKIRPSEIAKFDEAFTTGTATEVTAVVKIDNKKIGNGKVGDVTAVLKDGFSDLVRGQNVHMNKAYKKWFHKIY